MNRPLKGIHPLLVPFAAIGGVLCVILILPAVGIAEFNYKGLGRDPKGGGQMYLQTRYIPFPASSIFKRAGWVYKNSKKRYIQTGNDIYRLLPKGSERYDS